MKTLFCINKTKIADAEIKTASVIKETPKTYVAVIDGETRERTIRKSDMENGFIYVYHFFEEYTDALMWIKDYAEQKIIANTDLIHKKENENGQMRLLIKRSVIDAIASVNADEDAAEIEKIKKENFVKNYLSPLLRAADICVSRAEYVKDETTNEETVIITHTNGYQRSRCVTADSLIALVCDTMRELL